MGCASSAALPFLSSKGNHAIAESPRFNGKPPYELNMVNNKLKENGIENVKDINESYVSEKMKEVVDSTAVQGVIGGVINTKDEIVNQVKGVGETIGGTISSVVDGVENTVESAFGKITSTVGSVEGAIKSEMKSLEDNVKSFVGGHVEDAKDSIKAEDLDELLDALPAAEEVTDGVNTMAEEIVEKAAESVDVETSN